MTKCDKKLFLIFAISNVSKLYLKKLDEKKLKGTVSVISRDPSCKDGYARFITVPLKP